MPTLAISGTRNVEGGVQLSLVKNGESGDGVVFSNRQALREFIEADPFTSEDALRMLLRIIHAADPTFTNPSLWEGKVMNYSLASVTAGSLPANTRVFVRIAP